jgi:broad-specificity NMP kinase
MIFNRNKYNLHERVIVVSGLPRSGTSLMMKMLEAGGIPPLTDGERVADQDNPKGYYEFERVKKLREGDIFWLPDAKGKAVKVIGALLPYLPAEFDFDVVFMRRAMPEILASQRKMLENRGEDTDKVTDQEMAKEFQTHLNETYGWMKKQQNIRYLEVDYNHLMSQAEPELKRIVRFFRDQVDLEKMKNVIDHNLYRQRSS